MRKSTTGAIAGAIAAMLFAEGVAADTKILFNVFLPRKHPMFVGVIDSWAKRVAKATEGRVTVSYPASSLAPPPRQWGMVAKSVADAAMIYNPMEARRLKLTMMFQLPLIGGSAAATGVAMNRTHEKFFAKANEFKGVKFLGHFGYPSSHIHMRDKKVTTIADLSGVKMRVSKDGGSALAALGAVPVPTPGARGHEVISKGVVDGSIYTFSDINAFKLIRYVKHSTYVPGGLLNSSFTIFMNQKKWASLSKKDQAAITKVSFEEIGKSGAKLDALNDAAIATMKKEGVDVSTASPAMIKEIQTKLGFLEEEWLKSIARTGVDGKAVLAFYRAEVQKSMDAK